MGKMTPGQLRAEAEDALKPLGEERTALLARLSEIDVEIKPLIIRAVAMEVPTRRIQALTGVSPNTARVWSKGDAG